MPKTISNSILRPRNESNVEDDPYEAPTLTYSKEMAKLVEANTITSKVEEEDSTTCVDAKMMKLNDEEEGTMLKPQNSPKK